MKKLILGGLVMLLAGCSNTTTPAPTATSAAPATPAAVATETPASTRSIEDEILAEAKTWTKAEEVWNRVHPDCKSALSEKHVELRLKALAGVIVLSKEGPKSVSEFSAPPNPAYTYPVQPTHVIKNGQGVAMYDVAVLEQEWYVVVNKPTEAGEKASGEYDLSEAEQNALAEKILSELTAEQRTQLISALKSKGKIQAIKELRKMGVHSLKVQKLAVEKLQVEIAK